MPKPEDWKGWQDDDSKANRIEWRDNIFWVGVVVESECGELQKVAPGEYIDYKYGNIHNEGHNVFGHIGNGGTGVTVRDLGRSWSVAAQPKNKTRWRCIAVGQDIIIMKGPYSVPAPTQQLTI